MSTIDALGNSGTAGSASNAFSELSSEQFVKIIFSELQHQDPLAPNDSKDLLAQLSSLRSIQSDMDLSTRLNTLVSQNQLSAASNLIGKRVSGVDEDFGRVEGVVQSVSRTDDGAVLKLKNGARVNMSNLDEVLEDAPPGTTGGTTA